jgi:succinoglycan biosynthesis transport protein ExoP
MSLNNQLTGATRPLLLPRGSDVEKELTIWDLWAVLRRRRATVVLVLLFCVVCGALICVFSTRRYQATAELQVEREGSSPLGLQAAEDGGASDALQDNMTLQTQAGVLESDSLALSVIQKLNLQANSDFQPKFSLLGWALHFITPDGPPDPRQASLEDSPSRRTYALGVFHSMLKVKPVAGTRLIKVSYLNPDPVVAADVVNSVSQGLAEYNFQIRHSATSKTAQWLTGQLADLRRQSEDLQAKVAQAQRESGVLSLGGVDSLGREQLYSNVLDKLQQATTAYTQAESNRISKQAIEEITKTGDPEAISELAANPMFAGTTGVGNSLSLVQSLRMQQAEMQSQVAELTAKFGPAYPKLAEMQSKVAANQVAIREEVKRIGDRARNDYEVARQVQENTHNIYLEEKRQADSMSDKAMTYTILRQEADESRTLYEGLFRQMKAAGILADFHSNNISIVDPARVPAKPARPIILLYMAVSVACGFLFGCCAAFLRDETDNKIRDLSELETTLDRSAFNLLPYYKAPGRRALSAAALPSNRDVLLQGSADQNKRSVRKAVARAAAEFPALGDTRSCYVESLRALRTSILSGGGPIPKVMLVTSSISGEGKSMLSLNLAALLAFQQKKVLLIDADLRRPMLHRRLGGKSSPGLSSFLGGLEESHDAASFIIPSEVPGLHILPAGPVPSYPAELLGSEKMRTGLNTLRNDFDFIIMDAPPVLPVTDSVILSGMVDFTLLVARHKVTERRTLERSYRTLQTQAGSSKISIVLNAVRNEENKYYDDKTSRYFGVQEQVHETV